MRKIFILSIALILSCVTSNFSEGLINRLETFIKSLGVNQNCEFLSHVISVDTKKDNYDLLMSYSTSEDCQYSCYIDSPNGQKINGVEVSNDFFHRQHYRFLRFPNLHNYQAYNFYCVPPKSEFEKFMQIEKATEVVTGSIQFPKNQSVTKIITFGDWSKTDDGTYTKNYVQSKANSTDAIVFLGDQGYDMYQQEGQVGNDFLYFAKPVTSSIPYQVTTGNHEVKLQFEDLKRRFIMPNKENSQNLFYSYDINNIHFVAVNSEIPYEFNEEYKLQFQDWLKKDLQSTNKKWKMVYLHRPLYCSMPDDYHCISSSQYMRDILEEIIMENKVDMVLTGHVHAYERLYPIYQGKVDVDSISKDKSVYTNPKYPVHIVCGAGGNREGFEDYALEDFAHMMIGKAGICEMTVTDDKIDINFVATQYQEIMDTFSIIKN